MATFDPALVEGAREEAQDLVNTLGQLISETVAVVEAGTETAEVDGLFRTVHSLKGVLRILELRRFESFVHKVEDFLEAFRSGKATLDRDCVNVLAIAIDAICDVVEHCFEGMGDDGVLDDDVQASLEMSMTDIEGTLMQMLSQLVAGADKGVILKKSEEGPAVTSMGDDEAARLLAEMEGEPAPAATEMADDEAARLLAEMEGVPEKAAIDDDEASRLLAEMEAPVGESVKAGSASTNVPEVKEEEEEAEDLDEEASVIDDPEILSDFMESVVDIFENLDSGLLALEEDPNDQQVINDIFRNAHTLKGTAGMFGFTKMVKLTHVMENIFDRVRKKEMTVTSAITDVFFESLDKLRAIVECIEQAAPVNVDIRGSLKKLKAVLAGKEVVATTPPQPTAPSEMPEKAPEPASGVVKTESAATDKKPTSAPEKKEKSKTVSTIRVDIARLDHLVNLVGELIVDRSRFHKIDEELRNEPVNSSLRSFMTESIQMFARHMSEVQDITMKVRMVPIGNAFNKFPRVVRDTARGLNKEIDLIIEGADTELDKTLVEEIADPLVHLIRNSVDHGVEMPDVREKAGKQRRGTIFLRAYQEGNAIVIEIEDDGKGMPVEILRRKAIEKNLIKESDVLSKKEILNLIFAPGFSTADQVSNLSGRGVGMDVVKRNITKLKGIIDLDSEEGKGSKVSIKVPLTIGILQSLIVRVDHETFAIPLGNVIESLRITPAEIQLVNEFEVITLRDQVLPLIRLEDVLKLDNRRRHVWYEAIEERPANDPKKKLFIVVVGLAEKRIGLIVDSLVTQQEVVIKSIGPLLAGVTGFAGGMILGDGNVALILDIPDIVESARRNSFPAVG